MELESKNSDFLGNYYIYKFSPFLGRDYISYNALYVIARSEATWQSPGRVTL